MSEIDRYFEGYAESRKIFDAVREAIEGIGEAEIRVGKSQVSFRRKRAFAWAWVPGKALKREAAPLVLSLGFRQRHESARWKEITEAAPGRFTHHMELQSVGDVDAEVRGWLKDAWDGAG